MTGDRERLEADAVFAADMALLDELLNALVRREQPLSEEDLDRALGVFRGRSGERG